MRCGDAAGALRWLEKEWEPGFEQRRLALLDRAYSQLGDTARHAAAYLHELRAVAPNVSNFRAQPTHEQYEASLRANHGRKTSFWSHVEGRRG